MENLLNSSEHDAEIKALFTSNYLKIKRLLAREYVKTLDVGLAEKIRELTKAYKSGINAIEKW